MKSSEVARKRGESAVVSEGSKERPDYAASPVGVAEVPRVSGRRDFHVALPAAAADCFVDFGIMDQSLCVASPVS